MQLREVFKALKTIAAEGIISVVNREIQRKVEFVQRRDLEQGKGREFGAMEREMATSTDM